MLTTHQVQAGFGTGTFRLGDSSYGWNAAKRLAARASSNPLLQPFKNADNLALFASAVRLLNLNPAVYVSDDGKPVRNRPQKRGALFHTEDATTPVAFEGFMTVVKEIYAAKSARPDVYRRI